MSQSASTPASPPGDASAGSGNAKAAKAFPCDQCRRSKTACSKDRPTCRTCFLGSKDCIYIPIKKIKVLETDYEELVAENEEMKRRFAEYEETFKVFEEIKLKMVQLLGSVPRPMATSLSPRDNHALNVDFNHLSIGQPGQTTISPTARATEDLAERAGDGSADSVLRLLFHGQYGGLLHGTSSLPDLALNLATPTANLYSIVPGRMTVLHNVKPPHPDGARVLFEEQYTYIGTILAFADRASFERLLVEVYSRPLDLADSDCCLAHAKLLILMAFGQLYSINQHVGGGGLPGYEYFAAAVQLLPEIHERASVTYVETLCLVGYFMQNVNHRSAAFFYVGLAVRMAMSLGLHQEVPTPTTGERGFAPTEEEREHRRRVWWSVYSLDRILSVKSGNPLMIHDEDIGVAMPARLPSEPLYCPAVVLHHYTQLSRILGDIAKQIYRPRTSSTREFQEAMESIVATLRRWRADLPAELEFDLARLRNSRESVSTLLHFYQCVNMAVRPFVYTMVKHRLQGSAEDRARDWREGMSEMTQGVVTLCINAARDTVHMMTLANEQRLVANYGYMDTEHAFSAAIILLMVCTAFPPDPANTASLRGAVALLGSMWHRGNEHIGTRYLALHQLAAEIAPGLLPEPAVRGRGGRGSGLRVGSHGSVGGGGFVDSSGNIHLPQQHQQQQYAQDFNAMRAPNDIFAGAGSQPYGGGPEMPMGAFLVNIDGMANMAFGAAEPGVDQRLWDNALDEVMRE